MTIKTFTFNPFQENTYILSTGDGEAMIIDPGCYTPTEEQTLLNYIQQNKLIVKTIINTHLHIDHVLGIAFLEKTLGINALAHSGDEFWLKGLEAQAKMFGMQLRYAPPTVNCSLQEGNTFLLGSETFHVLEVPGHSPGSVVLHHTADKILFVGDVLFAGSIGRSDLTGGDHDTLIKGILQKLMVLPDETVVYSGHGPSTTIGKERLTNPYL